MHPGIGSEIFSRKMVNFRKKWVAMGMDIRVVVGVLLVELVAYQVSIVFAAN